MDKTSFEKDNLKILGIMIRVSRHEYNYSLRKLSSLTNISHTLISNIEKGKQSPSEDTLRDIFKVLNIDLYTDKEISSDMSSMYKSIYNHLINYQYSDASMMIEKLERKQEIYENSFELINYFLIRTLFYTMSKTPSKDTDINIIKFKKVIEYLSPVQQQIFWYIEGINYLNKEQYKKATESLLKGLTVGDIDFHVLIEEQLVMAYFKQYRFTDSVSLSKKVITEYESKTNYVRAMNCRLTISKLYTLILKLDQARELIQHIENFAIQFNVSFLKDGCHEGRAMIHFFKNEYDKANLELDKIQNIHMSEYYLARTKIYIMEQNSKLAEFYSNEVESNQKHMTRLKYLLIQVLVMWQKPLLRDEAKYLRYLKELMTLSIDAMDQENIGLSHNLLILYYKDKSKYKKALEVAENLLLLKKIHISYYSINNS